MPEPKTQLNVRLSSACVDLIKLERRNIPDCHSDGEALESIILRDAKTRPEAIQVIRQAALRMAAADPIMVAAGFATPDPESLQAGIAAPAPRPQPGKPQRA